jgi:hypothetical protein
LFGTKKESGELRSGIGHGGAVECGLQELCTLSNQMHKRQWALLLTPLVLLLSSCAGLREPVTGTPCAACAPCAKCPGTEPAPPPAKPLQPARWEDVQGWADDNLAAAWPAFQQSCRGLAGKPQWPLWRPACEAAKTVDASDSKAIRHFFESQFQPFVAVNPDGNREGLVTGYYEPLLAGARGRSERSRFPLHGVPKDLLTIELGDVIPELKGKRVRGRLVGNKVVPYYSRAEIIERERGASAPPVLLWVDDPIELFFLQILFILLGAIMVLAMHAGFAFLEARHGAQEEPGQCAGQDPRRFLGLDHRLLLRRLQHCLRRQLLSGAETLIAEKRLRADQVLLPADLRRGDPGHRFRRHRRARAVQPATDRHLPDRRLRLPVLRRHRLESGLRHPGLAEGNLRRGVPRLRRFGRGACDGRLDRPAGRAAARRALRALRKERRISAHPPSSIPFLALGAWILTVGWFGFNVMSAQTLDKISGLVAMNSLMAMVGGTLVALVSARTTPASCITARWPAWSPSAPAPT